MPHVGCRTCSQSNVIRKGFDAKAQCSVWYGNRNYNLLIGNASPKPLSHMSPVHWYNSVGVNYWTITWVLMHWAMFHCVCSEYIIPHCLDCLYICWEREWNQVETLLVNLLENVYHIRFNALKAELNANIKRSFGGLMRFFFHITFSRDNLQYCQLDLFYLTKLLFIYIWEILFSIHSKCFL